MVMAALFALLVAMPVAQAQTITNVAAAQWTENGNSRSTSSNTVTFTLAAPPVTIDTFVPVNGGQQHSFTAPTCGGNPLSLPGGLGTSNPAASLTPTATYRIGDLLFFQVTAPAANLNPAAVGRCDHRRTGAGLWR